MLFPIIDVLFLRGVISVQVSRLPKEEVDVGNCNESQTGVLSPDFVFNCA